MKLQIKKYEFKKIEVKSREIELPTETSYYFETGVRRSIKIKPVFTTWNKENFNKDEELHLLEITCIYSSFMCEVEKFHININEIEEIYYSDKHKHNDFIRGLVQNWFDKRTEEQFNSDLNFIINKIKE